jgi:hypothetical protein
MMAQPARMRKARRAATAMPALAPRERPVVGVKVEARAAVLARRGSVMLTGVAEKRVPSRERRLPFGGCCWQEAERAVMSG